MTQTKPKTSMSVPEMRKLLGLGKTESYYLVKKNYFKTIIVGKKMRVMVDSFEEWYGNQSWYKKVDGTPPGELIKQYTLSAEELGMKLGITETSAYELMAKGHFEDVPVLGKKRITQKSFDDWYASQSFYRTVEDQQEDMASMEQTYSMPEIARMLGMPRKNIYHVINKNPFEIVQIGRYKRITKESFHKWYERQETYILKADAKGADL